MKQPKRKITISKDIFEKNDEKTTHIDVAVSKGWFKNKLYEITIEKTEEGRKFTIANEDGHIAVFKNPEINEFSVLEKNEIENKELSEIRTLLKKVVKAIEMFEEDNQ